MFLKKCRYFPTGCHILEDHKPVTFCFYRHRIPKNHWWLKLRPLLRILAKHESAYEEEGMYMTVEDTTVAEGVI
jgi:hypothetical protein